MRGVLAVVALGAPTVPVVARSDIIEVKSRRVRAGNGRKLVFVNLERRPGCRHLGVSRPHRDLRLVSITADLDAIVTNTGQRDAPFGVSIS